MTYGELVWSVSIDDADYFIYKSGPQDFIDFLESKGINVALDDTIDLSNIRKQTFVFGKELQKKLRQEYPHATSIGTSLGQTKYVR